MTEAEILIMSSECFVKLLNKKNISCSELAKKAGINKRILYQYKNGETGIGIINMSRICTALNITPAEYWGGQ